MATAMGSNAVGQVACPGDEVLRLPDSGDVRIGSGLRQQGGALVATKAGVVCGGPKGKLWLLGNSKRYIPAVGEPVVGIVTERHSETYAVHIGGPFPAQLPALAFEGATRRNRPNLQVGSLVYARVETACRDMDPTLSCVDASTGKAAGFGPLTGGLTFEVGGPHARELLAAVVPSPS